MKFTNLLNLVCVALIAGHIGAKMQEKKDLQVAKEYMDEIGKDLTPDSKKMSIRTPHIFPCRSEAEAVLGMLDNILMDYGQVTVCDLQNILGEIPIFKNDTLGWKNLKEACIIRIREGYLLKLPMPEKLY